MLTGAFLSVLVFSLPQEPSGLLEPVEIRALVVRPTDVDVLGDPAALGAAMQRLSEIGFNAVVPLAWERGRTLCASPVLTAAGFADTSAFPGRDVFREIVFEAHRAGLEVLVGLDGALTIDPILKPPAKLPLASGAKDRLDPRDALVRTLARGFALELAKAAEIDGFVLWNGLTAFTVDDARDPVTKKSVDDSTQEFAAWREELRAFDKALVVGWAATDARFAPPSDAKALDFLVFSHDAKDVSAVLAAWTKKTQGHAALWRALDDSTTAESFAADASAARIQPFQGELLASFAVLTGREGLLADVLNQGLEAPYYARATLPWRGGVAWRPAVEMLMPVDDSGTFADVEADIPFSKVEAGLHANASWAWRPDDVGPHDLWLYLPPGTEELPALDFTIPTDPRRVRKILHPAGIPRGWTHIGRATFTSHRREDVLRLAVPAGGAHAVAIGPLVALPRRRADGR